MIREKIKPPYFVHDTDLPGLDFNRDIVAPGTNKVFPDGTIGIRVDGDFWAVAALPYEFLNIPLKDIVEELWPQWLDKASFKADSGTIEQKIEFTNEYGKSQADMVNHLNKLLNEANLELDRLRAGRMDLHERHPKRRKLMDNYFIRQYEHLLIAMAHYAEPKYDMPGFCVKCGLLCSDRVHMELYIKKHEEGYEPQRPSLAGLTNDD